VPAGWWWVGFCLAGGLGSSSTLYVGGWLTTKGTAASSMLQPAPREGTQRRTGSKKRDQTESQQRRKPTGSQTPKGQKTREEGGRTTASSQQNHVRTNACRQARTTQTDESRAGIQASTKASRDTKACVQANPAQNTGRRRRPSATQRQAARKEGAGRSERA
jgi:hypothetical protein